MPIRSPGNPEDRSPHAARSRWAVVAIVMAAHVLVACTTPPAPTSGPPTSPPPGSSPSTSPTPTTAPQCCAHLPPHKDQPPDIKLKLGHFANARRGIGLVFDHTTAQAKLRFDGTTEIVKIDPQAAGIDRIDFIRSLGHVVLQKWSDGRVVVFIGGTETGIDVVRDGDADPL